jgi:3-oxoadipate enol-lactonase
MPFHEHSEKIERPGCTLKYWISGDSNKPLIFMAHGATVDHQQFDLQMSPLLNDYQIIRWDMRGHGQSRPLEGDFSIKDAAEDMVSILDNLGRNDALFMGQSAGTYVIQELAFQHPERVKAMIIIDGTYITAKLSPVESLSLRTGPLLFRLWPYGNLKKAMANVSAIKKETRHYLTECFNQLSKDEFIKIWDGLVKCIHYEPDYHVSSPLL